jgi:small-conductance mechanosensitive channel
LADANTVFQQWQVKASQAGILGDRRCIRAAIWLPVALLLVLAPALIVSGLWYITAFASGQASTPRALAFVGVAGVVVIICALYIPFITWVGFKFEKRLLVGPSAHTLAIRLRPRAMAVHGQFNRDLGLR